MEHVKDRMLVGLFRTLAILLLAAAPAFPHEIAIQDHDQFNYARTRMEEGAYLRAAEEFERFISLFPESPDVPLARYLMGMCYLEAQRYAEARETLSRIAAVTDSDDPLVHKALFLVGESYYRDRRPGEAADCFREVLEKAPSRRLRDAAGYRLGWARMWEGKWEEASTSFRTVTRESPLYDSAIDLERESLKGIHLPYKSPTQAGVLAAVLPGLGHAYVDRYRSAIVSFLLNGLFIWATVESFHKDRDALAGVLALVEAGWYAGNIYGAINAAHKYNRRLEDDFRTSLKDRFRLRLIASKEGTWGLSLAVRF